MKLGKKFTLVLAMMTLPALADARPGPPGAGPGGMGKFWKRPAVREALQLTQDQVRELDDVFSRNQRILIDLKADVEKKRLDLDAVLSDSSSDDKKIASQVDRFEEARSKLSKAQAMMLVEARRVLSPDQREKLEELRAERGAEMRRGAGAPGPRGGRGGRRGGAGMHRSPGSVTPELNEEAP